ncbi:hypothetical protein MBLNU459_g5304t3 [Dothideomycetes sp. NU459]
MASAISGAFRSFWHTMTSNDRHASPDSPYRTGAHTPLSQSRHAPLTSVATAAESRTDLSTSYSHDDSAQGFMPANSPYSPGLRSTMQRQSSTGNLETMSSGEIQMQSFSEGLPPPPPVSHSWKRIDTWSEHNYEEVFENLCEGCTQNDVNELEHEMDCTLPMEVRESLMIHDGQERGGRPTGIIFGCMLLDCEEIVQEWRQWARVNDEYLREARQFQPPQAPIKAFAGASSSAQAAPSGQAAAGANWRSDLMAKQESQPPNAIQKAYVHPAWIPLARDWGGNNIAVDLAPGPTGKWGQVILMGRDYDCKYVIARSWSAFLATVADDMSTDKWFINEETSELKLREFKQQNVEPSYMDILRWRADQKYGRRGSAKGGRPPKPLRVNSKVKDEYGSLNGFSPYASPTTDERGRSPQRFSTHGKKPATSSPRSHIVSPLARVTEEAAQPIKIHTDGLEPVSSNEGPNLMTLDSPLPPSTESPEERKENIAILNGDDATTKAGAEEMKTVEI